MKPNLPLEPVLDTARLVSFLSYLILFFMVVLVFVLIRQNKLRRKYKELSDKFKE